MPQATRIKHRPKADNGIVGTRHEEDLYTWVQEQVALLRAGNVTGVDAANIAEELWDVGAEQYDKLASAFTVLLQHLLKWDFRPERRSRSWDNTVAEQRDRIVHVLQKNPGLKPRIAEAIAYGYRAARLRASTETGLSKKAFPLECPYSHEEMMNRPIDFDRE